MQAGTFAHCAFFYRGQDEYARDVCSFVREGLAAAEPVLVAVPGRRLDLVRAALAAVPAAILCPYDASGLTAAVLEDARRTHPRVVEGGARRVSDDYSGTVVAQAIGGRPLPSPPPQAQVTAF